MSPLICWYSGLNAGVADAAGSVGPALSAMGGTVVGMEWAGARGDPSLQSYLI